MSAATLTSTTPSATSTSPSGSTSGIPPFPGLDNYLGPALLSALVQALEMGVIINQAITFVGHTMVYNIRLAESPSSSRMKRSLVHSDVTLRMGERRIWKFVAFFALAVSLFQTACSFESSWGAFVVNFGDWPKAVAVHWPQRMQSLIVVALAAPVQSFLIWRCWLLTRKNPYILVFLALLLVSSIVLAIINTVQIVRTDFTVDTSDTSSNVTQPLAIDPIFVSTLAVPGFLDVCITGILLNFLLRSRTVVVSNRFRKTLQTIIIIVWEAALPPSICALLILITYFTLADSSAWDLFFQSLLGQLYVISLFVTLNGFNDVRNRSRDAAPTTALGYNLSSDNRVRQRSRISSSNNFTMSIEINSTEGRSPKTKRTASTLGTPRLPQSPCLQLSFPPTPALHLDIPKVSGEGVSPIVPSSATNTELDTDGGFHSRIFEKELKSEKKDLAVRDRDEKDDGNSG